MRYFCIFLLALFLCSCDRGDENYEVKEKEIKNRGVKLERQESRRQDFIEDINHPPRITQLSIFPEFPVTGDSLEAKVKFYDPDGDDVDLRYIWRINGEVVYEQGNKLPHNMIHAQDEVVVTVIPSDGYTEGHAVSQVVIVGNSPPEASLKEQSIKGDVYTARIKVKDAEGDRVFFSIKKGPKGMEIDENGNIKWIIGKDVEGTFPVEIEVRDEKGGGSIISFNLKIKREK